MEASVERWGYVTTSGAEVVVDLLCSAAGVCVWRVGEWPRRQTDVEACVREVAANHGHEVARVLPPSELSVMLRLSRASARAWRRLLAQWAAIGTLGEPGEELARELAAALGEELGR